MDFLNNYKKQIEWKASDNLVGFDDAHSFMKNRVEDIIVKKERDMIWLLEHQDVYTAGVSAKDSDLIKTTDIPIIKTNRGGKYTYHGPGMKIIYTMLDLKKIFYPNRPDIARFVKFLEEWIIDILAEYDIPGEIRKDRVGIWVKTGKTEKKIAAIGIKIRKWVSYHGIAINLDPDLSKFNNIIPCGINEFGVTSLQNMGVDDFKDINELIINKFYERLAKFKT